MVIVEVRRGRSCLMTLAMASPVWFWMRRATASAVNTMVRCASIDSLTGPVPHEPSRIVFGHTDSPNDFHILDEQSRPDFQQYDEQIATPFEWKFTKDDLNALLERIAAHEDAALTPAA